MDLTLAVLNDHEVKTTNIENAYMMAPISEQILTVLGPEFGSDAEKRVIIIRALYGLKSAGASFHNHLVDCMIHLGLIPCKADQDIWMKAKTRPSDGHTYFVYALLYINDILLVHHDAMTALIAID